VENDKWNATLNPLILKTNRAVEDDQTGDEISYSASFPDYPGDITLSYSEKAESLAESLEAQCQLITVPSFLAFIGMCDVALRPTSRPKQSNPS